MEHLHLMIFYTFVYFCAVQSKTDLPMDLRDPVLFCEGCYGSMYEIDAFMNRLKHETLKNRISNTLDQVCHTDHLRKYVFSPPKMAKVRINSF